MLKSYKNMGLIFSILALGSILLVIIIYYTKYSEEEYIPTEYEKELIEYFKEVVLESEYYENPRRITKWAKPMLLFVSKDKEYKSQMETIKEVIVKINNLATDGFKIKLVDDLTKSNAALYLGTKDRVAKLDSNFYRRLDDEIIDEDFTGLAYVEFEWRNYTIPKARIFISSEESLEIQRSTILEELTQSIGIPNDSEKYPDSIFYQYQIEDSVINKEYAKIDSDIVRLLYHPKMKPGLNSNQCEKVIKRILQKEARK